MQLLAGSKHLKPQHEKPVALYAIQVIQVRYTANIDASRLSVFP
jgi:hypothetical protein